MNTLQFERPIKNVVQPIQRPQTPKSLNGCEISFEASTYNRDKNVDESNLNEHDSIAENKFLNLFSSSISPITHVRIRDNCISSSID